MPVWCHSLRHLRPGDWLVLSLALWLTSWSWLHGSQQAVASKCQIRQGGRLIGTYDLHQERHVRVHGPLGDSHIHIHAGKVRFEHAPCPNQYCVHQGWLSRAGQAALCLPNQVSITLLGERRFDSISY